MEAAPPPRFRFSPRLNRAGDIDWQPWAEDAFARARRDDKPILLALSASWCHWCHVMDETTYSDPGVIAGLNRDYVAVRVDADERPDVNGRYNSGGLPSTVFLTPDGEIIAGATYIPPEEMRVLVAKVAPYAREHSGELAARVAEMRAARDAAAAAAPGTLAHGITDAVVAEVAGFFDAEHGGFGTEPKFAQIDSLELLLLAFQRTGRDEYLGIVRRSVEAMMDGALYDRIDGGFYRYATRRDWSEPHYEKMLDDQAGHLRVLLALYRLTGDERFAARASHIIGYVDATLRDAATGAFLGSQDADEAYAAASAAERARLAPPLVDRTVYAAWNARMASAYLEASWTLARPELAERAVAALDFAFERMREPGGLCFRALALPDGRPSTPGLLADHVELAMAALDAYETLGRPPGFERAVELAGLLPERFREGGAGAFYDIASGIEGAGRVRERQRNLVENARAGRLFTRLYHLTRDREFVGLARAALAHFVDSFALHTNFASVYAAAVDALLHEPVTVSVVGTGDGARALHAAALCLGEPFRAVQLLDPAHDAARVAALSLPAGPGARAYVCVGDACSAPIDDATRLRPAVAAMLDAAGAAHRH